MMTLHWSPRSPYVRTVMIAAHELGLADRFSTVRTLVGGTDPHVALMRDNPLGKIPTLVLEDGSALYDSSVIIEYFDTLHAGPKLWPAAWPERCQVSRRTALGKGMLDVGLQCRGEQVRPAERQSAPHIALWLAKLRACVAALEGEADSLAAERFTVGHIAIGVALAYLDLRFAAENWRCGHPKLAAWHATFDARAAVQAVPVVDDL